MWGLLPLRTIFSEIRIHNIFIQIKERFMSLLRFKMVDAAINHTAVEVEAPAGHPSDYFGEKVFGRAAMRKYLDKKTYAALLDTMENRTP